MCAREERPWPYCVSRLVAVLTRFLIMTRVVSHIGLASPAYASDAPGGETLRITIASEPWTAPFTPADLASALRLRLPGAEVAVAAAEPRESASRGERSITVRSLGKPPALRVERGSGDATEFRLSDGGGGSGDAAQVTRRAALFIALFAEQGAPIGAPPGALAGGPAGGATTSQRPGPPATPNAASPARTRGGAAGWEVGAQLGLAFPTGDAGASATPVLTVHARRFLWSNTALELGARLTDEYEADLPAQSVGLTDRSIFAGVVYQARPAPRFAIDIDAALQYTHPFFDIDQGPVTGIEAPTSTRFAVRTGVGLVWSPVGHLTVGVSAASAFSFREREYVDQAGGEVLELGSMIFDVSVGAGARW